MQPCLSEHWAYGDYQMARHWYESVSEARDNGMGKLFLGCMLHDQGDLDAACECLHEARGRARVRGHLTR
jgi:hypothetical protein